VSSSFAKRTQLHFRVLLLPGAEGVVAVLVGLCTGKRLFRVAGTDHYLVSHAVQPGGYRLADHTGAEDAESHVRFPSTFLAR
jgi:hypothetical protein